MRGDFSRSTFDPRKHYTSVRMQQGRMQLDADWNEQMDILLYLLRAQAQDLLGPYGAPAGSAGFAVTAQQSSQGDADLAITAGRYYVDGILVENESDTLLSAQPYWPRLPEAAKGGSRFVVYLDVWERDLSGSEAPSILEPALNGLDTTTRTQTVWQVKLWPEPDGQAGGQPATDEDLFEAWNDWRDQETLPAGFGTRGSMQPRVSSAGYGLTNQLYRVEIHSIGDETTFKWSRDNGSVAFAVSSLELDGKKPLLKVMLEGLQAETHLKAGDWVELVDASFESGTRPTPLFHVPEPPDWNPPSVTFKLPTDSALSQQDLQGIQAIAARFQNTQSDTDWPRTILRRWDYHEHTPGVIIGKDGAIQVQARQWLPLENGIEVRFEDTGLLRAGDYWLIPARSEADGYALLWKTAPLPVSASGNEKTGAQPSPAGDQTTSKPIFAALPARRVDHHYAPLAVLSHDGTKWKPTDKRTLFRSLAHWEVEETDTERDLEKSIDDLRTDFSEQAATTLAAMHALRDEMLSSVTYQVSEPGATLEPGQVVALDPATGGLRLVTRDSATLVVGVIQRPVIDRTGNQPETRSYHVAQYGHQVCLVVGRVEPGDMLVPSDTPGCATSAGIYIQPGSVIGKALQGHNPADAKKCTPIAIMVTLR